MIRIYQDRIEQSEDACLSRIHSDDVDLDIFGLERRWQGNRSNISCIPAGVYTLVPWASPKFGNVLAYVGGTVSPYQDDVPEHAGRWGCLVHPANYWKDLEGCTAPGMDRGWSSDNLCVWKSRDAMEALLDALSPRRREMGMKTTPMSAVSAYPATAIIHVRWAI